MSSISVTIVDDYKGHNVAVVGMKSLSTILAGFDSAEVQTNISAIIEGNLSDIIEAARQKAEARRKSGFMISQTDYIMNGPMIGTGFSSAPYAFFQEKGGTTPTGGRVAGLNFFTPPAMLGMRQYIADMRLYLSTLCQGGRFTPRAVKAVSKGGVVKLARAAGRGTHKYIKKIAVGGGKFRYQYAPDVGTVGRRTRVLFPGIGKAIRQVGRRRRVS